MTHQHVFDKNGKQICCTQEEKIHKIADHTIKTQSNNEDCCAVNPKVQNDHSEDSHDDEEKSLFRMFMPAIISLVLLLTGIALDYFFGKTWFSDWIRVVLYSVAYVPVGFPVLKEAFYSIKEGEIFSEFLLMGIATIGAFAIGEYPEGVAVMLFYTVGEIFQSLAVARAKTNIKSLLDQRPDEVTLIVDNKSKVVKATTVNVGDIIQLKAGEKLGLDGILISESSSFNTAALTGESKPDTKSKGDVVLAGMINMNSVSQIEVNTAYADSKLSKILELVQNAAAQKAPTELFIRKFAKIYTPIVVALALIICFVPYFIVEPYLFDQWLYRALIFLVIACPCALVISIPLGYFGGIGAASKNGILFKGSNFLDLLANVKNVVMDKTGTMTEGVFEVKDIYFNDDTKKDEVLKLVNALEHKSTHPIATAIHKYVGEVDSKIEFSNVEEIAGKGLKGDINGKMLLAGNFKLLDQFKIKYDSKVENEVNTLLAIAYDNQYVGYLTIADKIKEDAQKTVDLLKSMNIDITMLSGDKANVVKNVADQLGISNSFGDLLPEDKVNKIKEIKAKGKIVAFVGDGVNDAPVVALSDIGIAMGGLGSDATIETADVVIQDDMPSRIPMAINIGKQTKKIVWQNIILAFTVKAIVLVLGAGGLATMWEAVFADVGVALLAILNAIRIQKKKF